MAIVRLEAIILRTYALGDTSRIAVLYTQDRGMLRAVAKGARQPRSKFAGALEPLTRVQAIVYIKEDRDLQLLSAAEPIETTVGIEAGLIHLTHAQAAVEFIDRLVWGEEPHENLYKLLLAALRSIAAAPEESLASITLAFQLQAAGLMGYRPVLDRCVHCRKTQGRWEHFAASAGGVTCSACATRETMAIRISPLAAEDLLRLSHVDLESQLPEPAARTGELLKLMEVYLKSHFQKFSGLRSLELLRDLETPAGGSAS